MYRASKSISLQYSCLVICILIGICISIDSFGIALGTVDWIPRLISAAIAVTVFLIVNHYCSFRSCDRFNPIISMIIVILALLLAIVLSCGASRLWVSWTLSDLPQAWFIAAFLIVAIYGAYCGRSAILRLSVLVSLFTLVIFVIDTILLTKEINPARMAYHLNGSIVDYTVLYLLFFLLPLPLIIRIRNSSPDPVASQRGVCRGIVIAFSYFVLITLRSVLLLGNLITLSELPLLRVLKMIELGVGLSNVEFIGIIALAMAICVSIMFTVELIFAELRTLKVKIFAKRVEKS